MKQKEHIHHRNHITQEIKYDLFGDLDFDGFCNIVMACAGFSTMASLALYLFCFYCI